MKKVFLLFGITAFSSVSAQQKDVFDIQNHVDKMVKEKRFPGAVNRHAEKTNLLLHHGFRPKVWELSHVLSNGDKVYTLGRDHMPCVVPDMNQFTIMPNISNPDKYFESLQSRQHVPGSIPNAIKPYRIIASK